MSVQLPAVGSRDAIFVGSFSSCRTSCQSNTIHVPLPSCHVTFRSNVLSPSSGSTSKLLARCSRSVFQTSFFRISFKTRVTLNEVLMVFVRHSRRRLGYHHLLPNPFPLSNRPDTRRCVIPTAVGRCAYTFREGGGQYRS
jgi:hypothetical protein